MNELELYKSRVDKLLEDISLKIKKLDVKPGESLIVQPNEPRTFLTPQYCEFLAENLSRLVPEGTKLLIIDRSDIDIYLEENNAD